MKKLTKGKRKYLMQVVQRKISLDRHRAKRDARAAIARANRRPTTFEERQNQVFMAIYCS